MFSNSYKTPLMTDPFDETKIIINTDIDKLEQNYTLLPSDHFYRQVDRIEKDIKLLSSCITKIKDEREKNKRNKSIKSLETRINDIKTQFLTRKTKTQIVVPVETKDTDTQQLLINNIINDQDQQLDTISKSLTRLQHTALSINNEVNIQNTILEEITIKVDDVNNDMNSTTSRIKKMNRNLQKNNCCKYIIFIALVVIFIIICTVISIS